MNPTARAAFGRLVRPLLAIGAVLTLVLLVLPRLAGTGGGDAAGPAPNGAEDDARERATLVAAGGADPAESARSGGSAAAPAREPVRVTGAQPAPAAVEVARARLRLYAFDRATGRAAATEAELWQLGLPEDDELTAGDAKRATVQIPREGLVVDDLPEGRYRVFALGRRAASEDPPELLVRAPETTATLAIDVPRLVRFTLDLRDVEGHLVEETHISTGYRSLPREKAPFAEPRRRKTPFNDFIAVGGGGAGSSFSNRTYRRGERGFEAGVFRERGCAEAAVRYKRFDPPGLTAVEGRIEGYEGGDLEPDDDALVEERTLIGVALPEGWFDRAILLPDGAYAIERGARIYVWSRPLLVEPGAPPDLWRACPVEVWCRLDGYEELRFERTVGDGPPRLRVMREKAAKGA